MKKHCLRALCRAHPRGCAIIFTTYTGEVNEPSVTIKEPLPLSPWCELNNRNDKLQLELLYRVHPKGCTLFVSIRLTEYAEANILKTEKYENVIAATAI